MLLGTEERPRLESIDCSRSVFILAAVALVATPAFARPVLGSSHPFVPLSAAPVAHLYLEARRDVGTLTAEGGATFGRDGRDAGDKGVGFADEGVG